MQTLAGGPPGMSVNTVRYSAVYTGRNVKAGNGSSGIYLADLQQNVLVMPLDFTRVVEPAPESLSYSSIARFPICCR